MEQRVHSAGFFFWLSFLNADALPCMFCFWLGGRWQCLKNTLTLFLNVLHFVFSLINGACTTLTWALMLVVLIVFSLLIIFSVSGMYMFSETDDNFSSFTLAFIALCRPYFGTFHFEQAYQNDITLTSIFVTTYYWIAVIMITVLSSAILIDGVRIQSEFETLQRRGLPPKAGVDYQKIFKKWINNFVRCTFYRYGCWRSPLMQDFIHSWFSARKWWRYIKTIRWCSMCRPAVGGTEMSYVEAYERLLQWKLETENNNLLYVFFCIWTIFSYNLKRVWQL